MTRTSHRGYILNWTKIDPVVSAQKSFEYVDGRTDFSLTYMSVAAILVI